MAGQIGSGTAEGMLEFIDWMVSSGYAPAGAMNAWKSAIKAILSEMEGEDYGSFDVRTFDPDEYVDRFQTKAMGQYKQESVAAYRSRFKKAIEAYRGYLTDQRNWKPPSFRASPGSKRRPANGDTPAPHQEVVKANANVPQVPVHPDLIVYPFPLRSGEMGQLHLPARLDKADAERLATFVRTLAVEPQGQLPSTTGESGEGSDA